MIRCHTEIVVGQIGILVGASDVGIESTNSALRQILESYHPLACIEFFSILNCVCSHRAHESSDDRKLVAKLLPHFETRIASQLATNHRYAVFHRTSLLWLIKNCPRFCSLSGKKQLQTVDHAMLSSSVLIANDLRASGQIVDGNTIDRISALLPFSQNLRPSTGPNQIARSKLLLTRIACREALRKRKDYICLEEEFDLHAGVRVADFLSIIFGAWIRFHYLKVENLPFDRKDYGLTTDHFQKTSVSDEHVLKALRRISKSAETFIEECTNANAADHHDFGLIQRSPLLELEDHFLCLDPEFLIDKAGVAIYWTMRESFPGWKSLSENDPSRVTPRAPFCV